MLASDLTYYEELKPSERGNDRLMFVGWTQSGRILEVGIEYFDGDDREHVFHAMDANLERNGSSLRRLGCRLKLHNASMGHGHDFFQSLAVERLRQAGIGQVGERNFCFWIGP